MQSIEESIMQEKLAAIQMLENELAAIGVSLNLSDANRLALTSPDLLDQVSSFLHSMTDL